MTSWFHKPSELFRSDRITSFWPTSSQSPAERINSSTRFILYLSCILYLINRDPRILLLAAMVIGALYVFDKSGAIKSIQSDGVDCQPPSLDNPMGNFLMSDFSDNPTRAPACYYPTVEKEVGDTLDNTIQFDGNKSRGYTPDAQRNVFARQFVSMPVTSAAGDQTAFAEWCYGKKFSPTCRDDSSKCDPNFWGVQTEAYAGLDSGDNPRGNR